MANAAREGQQGGAKRPQALYERHKARTRGGTSVDVLIQPRKTSAAIGQGAFAQVFKLRSKMGGRSTELVALKSPLYEYFPTEEADLMRELEHTNVVNMK